MEVKLIARFIQHFITSLLIHYSKKLVFYIDKFFNDSLGEYSETILCPHCGTNLRPVVLREIGHTESCPKCDGKLNICIEE